MKNSFKLNDATENVLIYVEAKDLKLWLLTSDKIRKKGEKIMEDAQIILERHEQQLRTLERDVSDLKAVQAEIRTMNETLVTLANELKHTNEHLARNEQKIDAIEGQPKMRIQQITTAVVSALAGCLISAIIGMIIR